MRTPPWQLSPTEFAYNVTFAAELELGLQWPLRPI
jgi:hypothetical protein